MSGRIAALLLAAGTSSRMLGPNKLLCEVGGVKMIERAARAALDSRCERIVVVTGWQAERVEAVLGAMPMSKPITLVRNPDYAAGLSSSLRCGLAMMPPTLDGALVHLGDMPWIGAADIDRLIDAFDPRAPAIVAPVRDGRRGNPVLWPKDYFPAMAVLDGDVGARALLERFAAHVHAVAFDTDGIFQDIDTPAQLAEVGGSKE